MSRAHVGPLAGGGRGAILLQDFFAALLLTTRCCLTQQEVLSELADILAAVEAESVDATAAANSQAGAGPEVGLAALTAAVHLLQWDQHVVSTASG